MFELDHEKYFGVDLMNSKDCSRTKDVHTLASLFVTGGSDRCGFRVKFL